MHCMYLNIHCMPFHIYNRGTASALTTRTIPRPFEIVEVRKAADVRLWPSLFTLQAPVVAVLWQLLLARSVHVKLNWFEPWALGLAVWLIYVADHLIDTAKPAGKSPVRFAHSIFPRRGKKARPFSLPCQTRPIACASPSPSA